MANARPESSPPINYWTRRSIRSTTNLHKPKWVNPKPELTVSRWKPNQYPGNSPDAEKPGELPLTAGTTARTTPGTTRPAVVGGMGKDVETP